MEIINSESSNREVLSSRVLDAPVELVYDSFANPDLLKKWWGPEGFTNTIHEFDLRPGGNWTLTMHGPDKGNYENASEFKVVKPMELVSWKRISKPLFNMEIQFQKQADSKTNIVFRMIFDTVEECDKMKGFVLPKNEENFDRLERMLEEMV